MIGLELAYKFNKFLSRNIGIYYHDSRIKDLLSDIPKISRAFNYTDHEECINWLISGDFDNVKAEILAGCITIGETYFFRDKEVFLYLKQELLPHIIRRKQNIDKRIRVLSAGCSTGEEAYSLSILLRESIPCISEWEIVIHGVDINQQAINKANEGTYTRWSFRQTENRVIDNYFVPEGNDWRIIPELKKYVSFSVLNLAGEEYPSLHTNTTAFDIVFCRNMLMYFNQETINRVVSKLSQCLLNEGYLFVSSTEAPLIKSERLTRQIKESVIFFYKDTCLFPGLKKIQDTKERVKRRLNFFSHHETSVQRKNEETGLAGSLLGKLHMLETFFYESQYEFAESEANSILQIQPENKDALYFLIKIQSNLGKISEALDLCDKHIEIDKFNAVFYFLKALINMEQGKNTEALALIEKALYLEDDLVIAHYVKGNLLSILKNYTKAEKSYTNALFLLSSMKNNGSVPHSDGAAPGKLKEIIEVRLTKLISDETFII